MKHIENVLLVLFVSLMSVLFFISCVEPGPNLPLYQVGDTGPAGGWIFYYDEDNEYPWTYLEAAPIGWYGAGDNDPTTYFGYDRDTDDGSNRHVVTSKNLGTGKDNTDTLVTTIGNTTYVNWQGGGTTTDYAAKMCAEYTEGGYDWFLPSHSELALMYQNLKDEGKGGFSDTMYWCSSTQNEFGAFVVNFDNGYLDSSSGNFNQNSVHPIRAF